MDTGYTCEEREMRQESQKTLHDPELRISATCGRVPVYVCHRLAAHLEFERPVSVGKAREALASTPGLTVLDDPGNNVCPMPRDVSGEDDVFVGRIRQDLSNPNGLALWIVFGNPRKGAALNSLQIAEGLPKPGRLKPRVDIAAV